MQSQLACMLQEPVKPTACWGLGTRTEPEAIASHDQFNNGSMFLKRVILTLLYTD